MNGIFSRKLLGAWGAMLAAVGLVIGQAKEVVMIALAGIFGVGGFQVQQQAKVDTTPKNGGTQ